MTALEFAQRQYLMDHSPSSKQQRVMREAVKAAAIETGETVGTIRRYLANKEYIK